MSLSVIIDMFFTLKPCYSCVQRSRCFALYVTFRREGWRDRISGPADPLLGFLFIFNEKPAFSLSKSVLHILNGMKFTVWMQGV
jgi:hypothetical protein